jgi:hypothetical protein
MKVHLRFKNLKATEQPPATQKAKGVWTLVRENPFRHFSVPPEVFLGVNSEDELQGAAKWPWEAGSKWVDDPFARPCPKYPRHGFVDSMPVTAMADVEDLYGRALAVDPEAEILVMSMIHAASSAIYIPESGLLTVGAGRDGATAGIKCFALPVVSVAKDTYTAFREKAGIDSNLHMYVELVYGRQHQNTGEPRVYVVQARSGPPLEGGVSDYIPRPLRVANIIRPTEDMLAWEALCQALANSDDTVVVGPPDSLSSHQAVHCMINGIAYVTREVCIGDLLEPPKVVAPPFDVAEFHRGVRISERAKPGEDLPLAIAILHNSIPLQLSSPYYSRLIGFALGAIFRGSAGACLGESRHYTGPAGGSKKGALGTTSRNAVYERAGEMENGELCSKLATFSYKFMHTSWHSSYGGPKWYSALVQTVKLWNLLTKGDHKTALAEGNLLLNMAHNGGWLFNKFIGQQVMTQAAEYPAETLASHINGLYQVLSYEEKTKSIRIRNYRSSAKWTISAHRDAHARMVMTVNGITWKGMTMSPEFRKVMSDTFSHV